jgi:creatinine amidohydrolase/Fe(II)-dependent formamide hydrolase-like protein
MTSPATRAIGELTSPEVSRRLKATSILCLPLGAIEQHGPHLPLNTDMIVAEGITRRIVARWGEEFDLWQLPAVALGLSREHDWAAGTLSLSVQGFAGLLREIAREVVRALPARNLVIVNGHGGNRGILENLLHEFAADFLLNACAVHPFDLAKVATSPEQPDVHGGRSETAVMLALAPALVRLDEMGPVQTKHDPDRVRALIFDRGVTFPWRTDDPRLAHAGIIGDPQGATPELGETIIASIVQASRDVLTTLKGRQHASASRPPSALP